MHQKHVHEIHLTKLTYLYNHVHEIHIHVHIENKENSLKLVNTQLKMQYPSDNRKKLFHSPFNKVKMYN